jgi:signal transduction histidine kinase/CheY-like chemotaxis protein
MTICEHKRADRTGSERWFHVVKRPVFDENGTATHVLQVANEITAHKQAERTLHLARQAAEAANRAKSEFLANMSHEIRTPMNGILASSDLLRHRRDLTRPTAEHVRIIAESGDLLLKLLGDILDLSKIEARQLQLEQHPFDLSAVVADTVALLGGKAVAGQVRLTFSIAPNLPSHLAGDSYRLRQVLLNLTSNAIKFTPPDGRVQISVTSEAPEQEPVRLRFEVRDTGIGMDATTITRVFDRFTQADSSTTRRYGGSGLGLAISSHLVRLMGGKLDVDSVPGRGSSFFFSLTLPRTAAPFVELPMAATVETELGLNVFVVEDNAVNRSILGAQLKQLGWDYVMARDGEEALIALLAGAKPDVILMDCHMPKLDGWETTRRLRSWSANDDPAQQRLAATPIIALTAAALPEERQRCLESGMDRFLAKPVRLAELRDMLMCFAQPKVAELVG